MLSPVIPRLVIQKDSQWKYNPAEDTNTAAWRDAEKRIFAYIQRKDNCYWIHWLNYASFCIIPGKDTIHVRSNPEIDNEIIQEIYFKGVLPYVIQLSGKEVLHASAVLANCGLVGFCGISGSGKSTLAYGLYKTGYPFWTDDSLVFEIVNATVTSYKIPYDIRLQPDSFQVLQSGKFELPTSRLDYPIVNINTNEPAEAQIVMLIILDRVTSSRLPQSIIFNQITGGMAYKKVLTHAYALELQDKARKRCMLDSYMKLISTIPIIELRYSSDLADLPDFLEQIQEYINKG